MTYILGWKYRGVCYLCGDNALTSGEAIALPHFMTHTSFGEAHLSESGRFVADIALKVIALDDIAVAFCGNYVAARGFVEELAERLRHGQERMDALRQTADNRVPVSAAADYSLLVVARVDSSPRLFSFNDSRNQKLTEHQNSAVVHFGSMPSDIKELTLGFLDQIVPRLANDPSKLLAAVISILQNFGIHDYLLPAGVGGSFCGLFCDLHGFRWQPDLFTLIYDSSFKTPLEIRGLIGTEVRENALFVNSTVTRTSRCYADEINRNLDDAWLGGSLNRSREHFVSGRFDYVTLMSTAHRTVTIVEMQQQLKSDYLEIEPANSIKGNFQFDFTPSLLSHMRAKMPGVADADEPFVISFAPFTKPAQPAEPPAQ